MKAVYLKELRNYFTTPLGYVFMAFMLVIFGIYFLIYGMIYQYSDYSYVLNSVTMLVLFAVPLLTMRMFSEEMRNKTDQLLLTAPIKVWKVVAGKYLAAMTLFSLALAVTIFQPIVLNALGGSVPTEKVIFMLIFLLDGIASMLPATQIFAMIVVIIAVLVVAFLIYRAIKDIYITGIIAVLGVGAAVLLYFLVPSVYDNLLINVADWSSLVIRYTDFYTGVFDFSNVVFYVTFTVFMVFLTVQVIEKRRWS